MRAVTVLRTGPRTLIVRHDIARSALGIPRSGPADRGAFDAGQALVGGVAGGGAFEVVLGGFAMRVDHDMPVAVTGAAAPVTVDGISASPGLMHLRAGSELALGMARTGLRVYVAVGGGIDGGRTGLLGGYGPQPVVAGERLDVREPVSPWPPPDLPVPGSILDVLPGPRFDHLASPAQLEDPRTVSPHSDRVGVRLDGPALDRTRIAEVPPEGLIRGAIQAPPTGPLVVFGPDHPVTGGYPVVGVLTAASCDLLAQRRPGDRVVFRWI